MHTLLDSYSNTTVPHTIAPTQSYFATRPVGFFSCLFVNNHRRCTCGQITRSHFPSSALCPMPSSAASERVACMALGMVAKVVLEMGFGMTLGISGQDDRSCVATKLCRKGQASFRCAVVQPSFQGEIVASVFVASASGCDITGRTDADSYFAEICECLRVVSLAVQSSLDTMRHTVKCGSSLLLGSQPPSHSDSHASMLCRAVRSSHWIA